MQSKEYINQKRRERRKINQQKLKDFIPTGTKICNKCHEEKDVKKFSKDYSSKDGLNKWCKECQSLAHKHRISNMVYIEIQTKICSICGIEKNVSEFWKDNKTKDGYFTCCIKCQKNHNTEYYLNNTYEVLKVHKLWQQANPEKYKQCVDSWYNSEAGKLSQKQAKKKRREIMKQLPNTFTKEEWDQCLKYFNYTCVYCGSQNKLQRDHFVSVLNYGPFTKENIVCACPKCNASKGDFDFFKWYPGQLFYSKEREDKILVYLKIIK